MGWGGGDSDSKKLEDLAFLFPLFLVFLVELSFGFICLAQFSIKYHEFKDKISVENDG